MNKKTIITILLALVAVAGQAQVKSSLDLCLRDEVTGEWLIGLFDNYAVFAFECVCLGIFPDFAVIYGIIVE